MNWECIKAIETGQTDVLYHGFKKDVWKSGKVSSSAEAYNSSIYIAVDTLEFLKKGGRVTAAGAALGSVLNIKPILTIQGGKLDAFAKKCGVTPHFLYQIELKTSGRSMRNLQYK